MTKISVVIITFNEEKNIGRCIESVRKIADEIIVVDSFSTDKTKDICLANNVRFFENRFQGHIEQKNYALTHAKHKFVLSLDADEALSKRLLQSIMEIKKGNPGYDGYTMNRLTNYCGKWINHCGWYPDVKLRLFDRTKGQWGGTNPHDKFIMGENTRISHLQGDILHYSFYTRQQHLQQIQKFSEIGSKALFEKGIKAGNFKMLLRPASRFIKCFFLKMGFLDGKKGFQISYLSAYANYLKYKRLKNLCKNKP
jgi:glycosyltransferase involved in cell wall biosynthesis